jgi:hypothetical protein
LVAAHRSCRQPCWQHSGGPALPMWLDSHLRPRHVERRSNPMTLARWSHPTRMACSSSSCDEQQPCDPTQCQATGAGREPVASVLTNQCKDSEESNSQDGQAAKARTPPDEWVVPMSPIQRWMGPGCGQNHHRRRPYDSDSHQESQTEEGPLKHSPGLPRPETFCKTLAPARHHHAASVLDVARATITRDDSCDKTAHAVVIGFSQELRE